VTTSSRIVQISGPTVVASGLAGAAIGEIVKVGVEGLLGEVIRVRGDRATLQVYEDTTGLALDEPVVPSGEPLLVELGPGLLGQVVDGVERPLELLAERAGDFMGRGLGGSPIDRRRRWPFTPRVEVGQKLAEGQVVGETRETAAFVHRVLVPPGISGVVREVRSGDLTVEEPVVILDDGRAITMLQRWPAKRARPYRKRLPPEVPLLTGQRVLDCFFPIAVGGTAIIPGGFGTGKTVLEQSLAKHAAADVIIVVGCGERGNEMTDVLAELPALTDPRSGAPLMERTILVVNTSNMPVAAREASIYTAVTIAEHYRDMGYHVALLADSTSRWAEALREISSRLEEMPGEEGYPTTLAARLAGFYERAGRVIPLSGAGEGAVTIVGAVSPPGGDFSEPVTQASLRVCGALWALAPSLATQRHFPAIDWLTSYTLYAERLGALGGAEWLALREEASKLLARERELAEAVQIVGLEALPESERAVLESARLLREGFLRQSAYSDVDASCPPEKTLWMLRLFLTFARAAARRAAAGGSWRDIAASGLPESLLRLGETPVAEMDAAGEKLGAAIAAALPEGKS
jgi:V/A-type H+-transporting ATPase subunit A